MFHRKHLARSSTIPDENSRALLHSIYKLLAFPVEASQSDKNNTLKRILFFTLRYKNTCMDCLVSLRVHESSYRLCPASKSFVLLHGRHCFSRASESLTLSPPIPLRLFTSSYWSNPLFLIFDIRALWRSRPSARAPECQKLKMVG